MNKRKHLTLVAAVAALLGSLPLVTVFDEWTWLIQCTFLVAAMCGVAIAMRSLRAPVWAPTVAMVATYLIVLTRLFPSRQEYVKVIPSAGTFANFNDLLHRAASEMQEFAAPVVDRDGFLLLTAIGVGAIAILVDFFAVVLRRPALAGLPMLAVYSVPVAVSDSSVSMLPFAFGAAGFLWLLVTDSVDRVRRFGRRFTGDGRDVDVWEPSPLAAAGQRLGLVGIALAVVLPLAVPGMTTGLLDRFGSGAGPGNAGGAKTSKSVSLFAVLSGQLHRADPVELLRVTDYNDLSPMYLRFAVADELTPAGFRSRQLPAGQQVNKGITNPSQDPAIGTLRHRAKIEIVNLEMAYLPVYLQPTKVDKLDNSWAYDTTTSTIYSSRQNTNKRSYTFDYARPEYPPDALRSAPATVPAAYRGFTSTPDVPEVNALVRQLANGRPNNYEKVTAIFDYFSTRNGFTYDLKTGQETTGPEIVNFLKNKRGYCVQYAAAMGWLVRAAGIPARVAFGFTRGGLKQGNTMTLTNYNLHAWTEVYFEGLGWVPFDPTPGTAIAGSINPAWAPNPSQPDSDEGLDNQKNQQTGGQSASAGPSTAPVDPVAGAGGGNLGGGDGSVLGWPFWAFVGVIVVLVLLGSPALSRLAVRRRRLRFHVSPALAGAPDDDATGGGARPDTPGRPVVVGGAESATLSGRRDAHHAWDELLDTMADYRVELDDTETPRATGDRLVRRAQLKHDAAAGALLLSRTEERARYARLPLPTDELRPALSDVRDALAARVGRRERIMAVLLPPSVLRRWRMSTVERFTDLVNGVGRWRDSVVRTLSVRRLMARPPAVRS